MNPKNLARAILFGVLTLLSFLIVGSCMAQTNPQPKIDTVIHEPGLYISHFSFKTKTPIIVTYSLKYKEGICKRSDEGFSFKAEKIFKKDSLGNPLIATPKDYSKSGYDIGHCVNAKDFDIDCKKEIKTFRFINSTPQKSQLNRGLYKEHEEEVREYTMTDSSFILCINEYQKDPPVIGNGIKIPARCIKLVYSISKREFVWNLCAAFTNTDSPVKTLIDADLFVRKYQLVNGVDLLKLIK